MNLVICFNLNEPHLREQHLDGSPSHCVEHEHHKHQSMVLPVTYVPTLVLHLLAGLGAASDALIPEGKARQRAAYTKLDHRTAMFLAGLVPETYRVAVGKTCFDNAQRLHGRKWDGRGEWLYIHDAPTTWPVQLRPPIWPSRRRWR